MANEIQEAELRALEYILGFLISGSGVVLWWMWRMLVAKVQANQDDCDEYQEALSNKFNDHRVYAQKEFASKDDLKEAVKDLRDTLSGVHRRFDEFFNAANRMLNDKHK